MTIYDRYLGIGEKNYTTTNTKKEWPARMGLATQLATGSSDSLPCSNDPVRPTVFQPVSQLKILRRWDASCWSGDLSLLKSNRETMWKLTNTVMGICVGYNGYGVTLYFLRPWATWFAHVENPIFWPNVWLDNWYLGEPWRAEIAARWNDVKPFLEKPGVCLQTWAIKKTKSLL